MSKRIITTSLNNSIIDKGYYKEKINIVIQDWSPKYGSPYNGIYAVIIADGNKFEGL